MTPAPIAPPPADDPATAAAAARLADALGHASTLLFNYRRDTPDAPGLAQVLNLELALDQRSVELRARAIRLLGAQAHDALQGLQSATSTVDAFLGELRQIEDGLTVASALLALAGALLVGDAGGLLTAVVHLHDALPKAPANA